MGLLSYLDGKYAYLRRYGQILRVLVRYGFADIVAYLEEKKRFKFIRKLIPRRKRKEALQLTKWEKMRMVCEELGPTFVKFGQILSSRIDLLPEGLIKELEKLQDKIVPLPGKVSQDIIEKELKKPVGDIFEWFEPEAFASASMAQVHKGILKTGEKVAVKVQRPGIREVIEQDVKVMLYMAEVFSRRVPNLKNLDPVGLVKNFHESILRELDFIHESVNAQRFGYNFESEEGNKGHVYTPKVFPNFTTSKVLVMEFIEGTKVTDISSFADKNLDRTIIAERLAISYFKQVFNYGFFHADPHPGNLFVLPSNVVCYIDYGMMGNIMPKDLEQFGHLFLAVRSKDVRKIIRSLQQLSNNQVIRNFRALESDLNEFVQSYSFRSVHTNEMSTILLELKDIIVKHNLKVPSHFFLLARSMVTIEGVIRNLDPELDLTTLIRPYLIRTISKHYNPLVFTKRILNSIYEMGMYMEEFPRDLKNAIRKINSGEVRVDLQHHGIDPIVHTFNRIAKQIVSAVVIAALLVGSTMMIVYDVEPKWGDKSAFGVIGLILAGIVAIGMIRNINKGDHDDWSGWEDQ